MNFKKLMLIALSCVAITTAFARSRKQSSQPTNNPACQDKTNCMNNQNCKCWCSGICGFRDKMTKARGKMQADKPVYVENDPNGNYCYCKQWDVEQYGPHCTTQSGNEQSMDADVTIVQ